MNKPHIHAELIKAWADGATIQHSKNGTYWDDCPKPVWEDWYYRVKPKPKVKKWRWVLWDNHDHYYYISTGHYSENEVLHISLVTLGVVNVIQKIDLTLIEVDDE